MALDDIWVKLDRAKEHLDTLNVEIDKFAKQENPLHVITEQWSNAVYDVQWVRRIPLRWSAIVGDCVHNLRSALDHIVWHLSGGDGVAPCNAEFPIFDNETRFLEVNRKGDYARGSGRWKIRALPGGARAAIYRLQPFHLADPTRHPLWILHELDRLDKHRALHPILGYGYIDLWQQGVHDSDSLPPGMRQVRATQSNRYAAPTPRGTRDKVKMRSDLALRVTLPPETAGSHENLDVLLSRLIMFCTNDVVGDRLANFLGIAHSDA